MARTEKINRELEKIHKLIEEVKISLQGKASEEDIKEMETVSRERDWKIKLLESRVAILQNSLDVMLTKMMEDSRCREVNDRGLRDRCCCGSVLV